MAHQRDRGKEGQKQSVLVAVVFQLWFFYLLCELNQFQIHWTQPYSPFFFSVLHPPLILLKCCYNTMNSWRCDTVVWINPFLILSSSMVIVIGCCSVTGDTVQLHNLQLYQLWSYMWLWYLCLGGKRRKVSFQRS